MSEPRTNEDRFDIDVGGYARAVARRWWLVLLLAVVGALTGLVWWYAQPKSYEATAAVYLGQPTDANGNAIVGVNSNPRAASQIVQGTDVIKEAVERLQAEASGDAMTARQIRRGLIVETPTITVKSTSAPTNYVAITVRGRSAGKTAAAANALASILVERLSSYATAKTELLQTQLAADEVRLKQADRRLTATEATLQRIAAGGGTAADKALAGGPYLTVVQAASEERTALEQRIVAGKLALAVVKDVESPAIISPAAPADEPTRTGRWLSVVAGGAVGVVVSLIVVAFLTRRRSSPDVPA